MSAGKLVGGSYKHALNGQYVHARCKALHYHLNGDCRRKPLGRDTEQPVAYVKQYFLCSKAYALGVLGRTFAFARKLRFRFLGYSVNFRPR